MGRHFSWEDRGRLGAFTSGFGGAIGMGGRAFLAGRRLASGELQLVLLALLEEHSGGFYSPSPGMIYPALTWLEEMSYARVSAEGAKKLYSITDAGRVYLQENRGAADAMLGQLRWIGRKMGRVREIFGGFDDEEEDAGNQGVGAARRELRQALREKRGAPAEEKQRIALILRDTAARIRGTG